MTYYPDNAPTWSEAQADLIDDLRDKARDADTSEDADYWRRRAEEAAAKARRHAERNRARWAR